MSKKIVWTEQDVKWIKTMDKLMSSIFGTDFPDYRYEKIITPFGKKNGSCIVNPINLPSLKYDHDHWEKNYNKCDESISIPTVLDPTASLAVNSEPSSPSTNDDSLLPAANGSRTSEPSSPSTSDDSLLPGANGSRNFECSSPSVSADPLIPPMPASFLTSTPKRKIKPATRGQNLKPAVSQQKMSNLTTLMCTNPGLTRGEIAKMNLPSITHMSSSDLKVLDQDSCLHL